jgi:hypothetical protein
MRPVPVFGGRGVNAKRMGGPVPLHIFHPWTANLISSFWLLEARGHGCPFFPNMGGGRVLPVVNSSNGNNIETQAERSFHLDLVFDIEAKRTCLLYTLERSKRSEFCIFHKFVRSKRNELCLFHKLDRSKQSEVCFFQKFEKSKRSELGLFQK